MKKIIFFLISTAFLFIINNPVNAQGCSDAGFCTLNNFKPNASDSITETKNQIKAGAFYGLADYSISVSGGYLEYNRQLNERFGIDVKLTSILQKGNDISEFGLSDIFLTGNYQITERFNFTLGGKIPLSNSNTSKNNLSLPMDYQSSLGTFDLILGIGYEFRKLQFVIALQQPLTQNNNQFISDNYPADSKLSEIQTTNKFIRSNDIMFRISYPLILGKITLTPSILPIYHLANDKYSDATGIEKEIAGSEGLTLNGNVFIDYKLNSKIFLQLNVGAPFVVRDARPDGLTREYIFNLQYKTKF